VMFTWGSPHLQLRSPVSMGLAKGNLPIDEKVKRNTEKHSKRHAPKENYKGTNGRERLSRSALGPVKKKKT